MKKIVLITLVMLLVAGIGLAEQAQSETKNHVMSVEKVTTTSGRVMHIFGHAPEGCTVTPVPGEEWVGAGLVFLAIEAVPLENGGECEGGPVEPFALSLERPYYNGYMVVAVGDADSEIMRVSNPVFFGVLLYLPNIEK